RCRHRRRRPPWPRLPEGGYDHLLDSLDELTDYAERVGVDLGIEFEPELLVEDTEEVLTLIDDVGSDALGVNFDVGHAAVCGEDPAESIRQCAGRITGVHLEDIAGGRGGKHYHLVPGEGDIEFDPVFGALDDIGYDGFATFELYTYPDDPDDAARRARDELADYVR
ncbi:sugar phosphate isomerase/epimerase family protein, partial [Haloferax volcanii]